MSLHVLFTAPHLASLVPKQQQVSHACACDGACGKAAVPALPAAVCGAAVKPHAAAVVFLRRAACTTICSMLAVMSVYYG